MKDEIFIEMFSNFCAFVDVNSTVIWVRNYDYSKQFFVRENFESIWKKPCQWLYDNPDEFQSTLVDDKNQSLIKKLKLRHHKKNDNESTTSFYRIHQKSENKQCIMDKSFVLVNNVKKIVATAGVAKCISDSEWENHLTNNISTFLPSETEHKILSSLKNELNFIPYQTQQIRHNNKRIQSSYALLVENEKIYFSYRELQCLFYLLQGMSAKQTASLIHLSQRTIETYIQRIKNKTSCRTKLELARKIKINENWLATILSE